MTATQSAASAPHRDNLLGICAALGEDLGFNPFYLRVALAAGVMFAPAAVLIAYGAAGVVVLASRLLVRDRKAAPAAAMPAIEEEAVPLRLAA